MLPDEMSVSLVRLLSLAFAPLPTEVEKNESKEEKKDTNKEQLTGDTKEQDLEPKKDKPEPGTVQGDRMSELVSE